ncbi:MAG: sugar-binding protein, partial [Armatimonadetes bacterium]|nr:sugar-binding protein [Armatimonadota bacterium]
MTLRMTPSFPALVALLGVALAGCSPQSPPTASDNASSATAGANGLAPPPSTGGPVFALSPKALNNPYFNQVREGANAEATRLGIPEPLWIGPTEADAGKQVAMINDLITKGVQGIGISPNAPDAVNGVITRAMEQKVPVITFDADAPKSQRIAYIGTDNFAAGRKAGEQMAKLLGGNGDVLVVSGGAGAFNLNERIRGFQDGIKGSGVKVASTQYCDDDQAKAHRIIQDYLTANPKTAGIFAAGLWAVLPAGQILKQKGMAGKVKVVGFDTLPEELQLVKDGSVQALIGQRPREMGRKSIEILNQIHKGQNPDQTIIDTGTDTVTSENVDQF